MHRKDSDRLPGYFVLRSGCQIVQGAVLTPAPTLIFGSSTGWVVHLHFFFATDHILQNCYASDGRVPEYLLDLLFIQRRLLEKINVLVLVIRTSRAGLFWY